MTQQFAHRSYGAIIIGARCAGAATALLLARAGARVLLIDREREIADTLSTHALMRPAVALLHDRGLLARITAAGTPAVRRTQFVYGEERIDIPIRPDGAAKGLFAPRRWLLDRIMCEAAVNAGVELQIGTRLVSLITSESGRVVGTALRQRDGTLSKIMAEILIGADGRRSMVADAVGAKLSARAPDCSATVYSDVGGIENAGYRWYFGDGLAAGLIPTTHGAHCLFTSCAPHEFGSRFQKDAFGGAMAVLATWEPEMAAMLKDRGLSERMRRYPGAPGHIRNCAGPGWALVGDAGHFKDPATAHGITGAFLHAARLARALPRFPGNAAAYQVGRDRFAPKLFETTPKIASLD